MIDLAIKLVVAGFMYFGVINLAALHTWLERKQSAIIQDRIGANRASIYGWTFMGLFHPLADSIKMFMELLSIRRNVFAQIGHLRPGAVPTVMPVPQKATTNQVEAA